MVNTSVNTISASPPAASVALIGLGGFGENYLRGLLDENDGSARLVAGVDLDPSRCTRLPQLNAMGIPAYATIEQLFDYHRPDLVVIATPAHIHKQQSCAALAMGCHVLCEKPAATTLADARAMQQWQAYANRQLAIGYQWSFCPPIQALKKDILSGLLGRPKRLKSIALWPRNKNYYQRNSWAGKIHGAGGEPIFDSPVSNACSHHLHNMLYLLGDSIPNAAWPLSMECEIHRINDIASFDTAVLRLAVPGGAEVMLVVSHAPVAIREPAFQFEFEDAIVSYDLTGAPSLTVRWNNGKLRDYGPLPTGTDIRKLWITLQTIRTGGEGICGINAALPHVAVASAIHHCDIHPIAHGQALREDLIRCYDEFALPRELKLSWSQKKQSVEIAPPGVVVTTHPDLVPKEHLV